MAKLEMEYLEVRKLNNVSMLGVVIFVLIVSVVWAEATPILPMIAIPLGLLVLLVILGKSSGVEFDFANRVYRKYNQNLWGRSGKWKCLDVYTDVVILRKKGSKIAQSLTGDNTVKGGFMELYLMYPDHRRRLFICASENKNEIQSRLKSFVKNGFNYVKYNPVRKER